MSRKPKFNPSRVWLQREIAAFAASLPQGAHVLDAGAGDQIYRDLFKDQVYEAADFELVDKPYAKSTYVCDLAAIPVEDNRFDAVVFSQVMEHLPEPLQVLQELHRVLKPGGKLFFSAPLFYEEHEVPFDFYRYTQFGLRHLFGKAGFAVEHLDWLEGYMGTLNHQLRRMARNLPFSPAALGGGPWAYATVALFMPLKLFALLAAYPAGRTDIRKRYQKTGMPVNYFAVLTALEGLSNPAQGEG